jgi:hypothetical protein
VIPILQPPEQRWECPNCDVTDVTRGRGNRFHRCSGLAGLTTALVPAGTRCKIEAVEREDFIHGADVRYDVDGRPVAAAVTTRDDGNDVVVYAPTAHMEVSGT